MLQQIFLTTGGIDRPLLFRSPVHSERGGIFLVQCENCTFNAISALQNHHVVYFSGEAVECCFCMKCGRFQASEKSQKLDFNLWGIMWFH